MVGALDVEAFDDGIRSSCSAYDMVKIMRALTTALEFRHFLAIRTPTIGEKTLQEVAYLSDLPSEIVLAYNQAEILANGPAAIRMKDAVTPWQWSPFVPHTENELPVMDLVKEVWESHGLVWGLFLPVHCKASQKGLVCFYGPQRLDCASALAKAFLLATLIFDRLAGFASDAAPTQQLTGREADCLRWTAAGKTSAEIAVILGISPHTVDHYLTTASQKLDAANRAHAVAQALRLRLID